MCFYSFACGSLPSVENLEANQISHEIRLHNSSTEKTPAMNEGPAIGDEGLIYVTPNVGEPQSCPVLVNRVRGTIVHSSNNGNTKKHEKLTVIG